MTSKRLQPVASAFAACLMCSSLTWGCGAEPAFTDSTFPRQPADAQSLEANANAGIAPLSPARQGGPELEAERAAAAAPTAEIAPAETPSATPAPTELVTQTVEPTPSPTPVAPLRPTTTPDIAVLCSSTSKKTRKVSVSFPATSDQCAWGVGDNLAALDGIVRARKEQYVSLNFNDQETLCGLKVSSAQQQIQFDDELTLTLNDVVLLSSYDYSARYPVWQDLSVYSWAGLQNSFNPGPATPFTPYCIGSDGTLSNCSVPKTETLGLFSLTVPSDVSSKLSAKVISEKKASLGLIVTGDDNVADCSHSDIALDVEIEYVDTP